MSLKPKRLLAHLELHLNILDKLPYALLQLNKQGKIVWANLEANGLTGIDPVDYLLGDIFPSALLDDALDAAMEEQETMKLEFRWLRNVPHDLIASIVPLTSKTTEGGWVILILQDVTSQRATDRMRADFVANVSHELRTPLSSLMGFIETIQGPASDDKEARTRFLRIMQNETKRMSRLVEDLLSLSRIEMNATQKPDAPVNISSVLRTVQESLELKAKANQQTIKIDDDGPNEDKVVVGDHDEITQVFWNLTDNAIKYSAPGTEIRIKIKALKGGQKISVSVKDKGNGISSEHLPRLTERFYRVDKARSRKIGGTGLGLAIVKHILNRHEAHMDVKSTLGKGTTFKVVLPRYI